MGVFAGGLSVGLWYELPGIMAQIMVVAVLLLAIGWAAAETIDLFADWQWLSPVSRFLRIWAVLGWWVLFMWVCAMCGLFIQMAVML